MSSASYVSYQRGTAMPVFAAERRAAAPLLLSAGQQIDRYHLPAEHSAANPQKWRGEWQTDGRIDRQTDGRTDARQLHRPCSAYYAGSVSSRTMVLYMS